MSRMTTYTVSYESESHWKVLTQMRGSLWPKVRSSTVLLVVQSLVFCSSLTHISPLPQVLPYCVFNVCLMIALILLDRRFPDAHKMVEVSSQRHSFVTLVVSFLLVSRVNTAMSRYNVARDHLGSMYRESRELIQNVCVFSRDSTDEKAKEWRMEIAYRCLMLLRTAMAVIDYPTTGVPAWEVPELKGYELEDIKRSVFIHPELEPYAHSVRSTWEETMRVPIRVAYLCRKTICSQSKRLRTPVQLSQENKLLSSIDGFMGGYYGIRKFLTTPVPFPLIQMARTFLFLYVYTIPFVMLSDDSSDFAHCFAVFLMTFGFMGLELVAIELDDPFGDDPNDFNNTALACTAYEDTYLTIMDVDGFEWASKLRGTMYTQADDGTPTETSLLLSKIV